MHFQVFFGPAKKWQKYRFSTQNSRVEKGGENTDFQPKIHVSKKWQKIQVKFFVISHVNHASYTNTKKEGNKSDAGCKNEREMSVVYF